MNITIEPNKLFANVCRNQLCYYSRQINDWNVNNNLMLKITSLGEALKKILYTI